MRLLFVILALLAAVSSAHAQPSLSIGNCRSLEQINCKLGGQVLDYTQNHGADRRIWSQILGQPRDLYVYVPPGYNPARAYPLVVYLHMAYIDEHWFIASNWLVQLDGMMLRGEFPPAVVICPDGMITGRNRTTEPHSMFVNGVNGRFGDHLLYEVLPFVWTNFSIRPERQAHALVGVSGGGMGAMSLALQHRELFATVATLAAPLNARYYNCLCDYEADFDPATFRWRETYDPDEVIGRFYCGLQRTRARKYIEPVFGSEPGVLARASLVNPAELLATTGLRPGELDIYVNYPGNDNFNFDAQDESFAWLASLQGVSMTLERVPGGRHNYRYFRDNHLPAFRFVGAHLLPPLDLGPASRGYQPPVTVIPAQR
jgi:S-formylglutathione hydrolase FrmB